MVAYDVGDHFKQNFYFICSDNGKSGNLLKRVARPKNEYNFSKTTITNKIVDVTLPILQNFLLNFKPAI